MGLYSGGMQAYVDHEKIGQVMQGSLAGWLTGHIQIFLPSQSKRGVFDPVADTYASAAAPTLIYDSGPAGALVSPIRLSSVTSFGDQGVGIQGLHFQCFRHAPDVRIKSGMIVKVLDGGNDATLPDFTFMVTDGTNSSLTWGHTYQARVVNS